MSPDRRRVLVQHLADALRLYVLTDRELAGGREEFAVAQAAIDGGATAIQLRWKRGRLSEAVRVGRELQRLCRERGILFVVNDRVDLALTLEADGVHVGVDDLPVRETRALVGNRMIVGYSPPTLQAALAAAREGADYLGIGPIYATTTKSDAGAATGTEHLAGIAREISLPIVGIGGITAENAPAVIEAGAAGVAVISAVVSAEDVRMAAAAIRRAVDGALSRRD